MKESRKTISRRDFLRLSALAAASVALAGCGTVTPQVVKEATAAPKTSPPETPTTAPTVTPKENTPTVSPIATPKTEIPPVSPTATPEHLALGGNVDLKKRAEIISFASDNGLHTLAAKVLTEAGYGTNGAEVPINIDFYDPEIIRDPQKIYFDISYFRHPQPQSAEGNYFYPIVFTSIEPINGEIVAVVFHRSQVGENMVWQAKVVTHHPLEQHLAPDWSGVDTQADGSLPEGDYLNTTIAVVDSDGNVVEKVVFNEVGHENLTEALKENNPDLIQEQRIMTDGQHTITVLRHSDLVAKAANPPFEPVGMTEAEFVAMILENLADHHQQVTRAAHGPDAQPFINALNWAEIQANLDNLIQPTDPNDPNREIPRLPMIQQENPDYEGVRENKWLAESIPVSMKDIDHLTVIQLPAEELEQGQPFPRERRALIAPDGKPLQVAMINTGSPTLPGYLGLIFNRRTDGSNELIVVSCLTYDERFYTEKLELQPDYTDHARLGHAYLQEPARSLHYSIIQSENAYQNELDLGAHTDTPTQMRLLIQEGDATRDDLFNPFANRLLALSGTSDYPITNPLFELQPIP